jgi:serine phosphatase RsbU (regulator of sigma subunit)
LGTTAAQDAAELLIDDAQGWGLPVRLVSDGEAWWGQITPFQLSSEHKLLIGVAVGEKAILGRLQTQRYWVIGITLTVLALAIWRTAQMARGYSRPVEELVQESVRISTGDLEPGPVIRTRISEVHQLTEAHDQMRTGLKTLLKLEGDLQVARQIQQSTLPERLPDLKGIDLDAWSEPADETGGDTYDVIGFKAGSDGQEVQLTDNDPTGAVLMLADATGHGIGPALSVTQLRAMLRMAVRLDADFTDLITNVNQQLTADLPTGRFITAWFGQLNTADYTLSTFSTGQAPLLRYIARREAFEVLDSNAVPLGLFPGIKVEPPAPVELEPGDLYIVLSDGLFEAKNPQEEEQGTERICDVIRHHSHEPAAAIRQHIRAATDEFTQGAPPDDDRTIIIIKRL